MEPRFTLIFFNILELRDIHRLGDTWEDKAAECQQNARATRGAWKTNKNQIIFKTLKRPLFRIIALKINQIDISVSAKYIFSNILIDREQQQVLV